MTINHLPDEVLLEIFDYYRQSFDPYYHLWNENYAWLNLMHVCRKWRGVMVASSSRLDLGVIVGPQKSDHIKTLLSGPLPILFEYMNMDGQMMTGSALWRMRATLEHHHDRVREINFGGSSANFDKFFKATSKRAFPMLESLVLWGTRQKVPDTFLGGPDLSDLRLRRLNLSGFSLESTSQLLSFATSLTDLSLNIDTAVNPSPEVFLLAFLQGMRHLRSLNLGVLPCEFSLQSRLSTSGDIVPVSKLTHFRYSGHSVFFNAFLARLSTPSLQDINIRLIDRTSPPPIVHLPQVLNVIEEHYHVAEVTILGQEFRLLLLTESEYIRHCKPRFELTLPIKCFPLPIMQVSGALSTRLSTVKELRFVLMDEFHWTGNVSWGDFYHLLPSVKVLRMECPSVYCIMRMLDANDHGEPGDLVFLPDLEEIELGNKYELRLKSQLAVFEPFVSALARQRAGRPVKVMFSPRLEQS